MINLSIFFKSILMDISNKMISTHPILLQDLRFFRRIVW